MVPTKQKRIESCLGFTLAEVLIALALLGIIAAFTIPKILQNSGNNAYNSQAKEYMGMLSTAYVSDLLNNKLTSTTTLTQFIDAHLNVTRDTSSLTDVAASIGSTVPVGNCAQPPRWCYRLSNGAIMTAAIDEKYNNTDPSAAWGVVIDLDGKPSGAVSSPGDVFIFFLMLKDGHLYTGGTLPVALNQYYVDNTSNIVSPGIYKDPTWFSF